MRIRAVGLTTLTVVLSLGTACSGPSSHDQAASTNHPHHSVAAATPRQDFVVVVSGDALGARELDYMAARGARQARASGASGKVLFSSWSDPMGAPQEAASSHPRLVLAFFFDPATLLDLARRHPDTDFVSLDNSLQAPPRNVTAVRVNAHESSYLAGVVAATMSRTHRVGAVLGAHKPAVDQFFYGFKQGVLATCPRCQVWGKYLDNQFLNPAAGAAAAKRLYRDGADIVFAVAAQSGLGVLQQARKQHRYAIGVDGLQDGLYPGTVITSVVKRVDVVVTRMVKAQGDGDFPGGRATAGGLAAGLSDISWNLGSTTFADHAPASMAPLLRLARAREARSRAAILSGRLQVCDALNDPGSGPCQALGLRSR